MVVGVSIEAWRIDMLEDLWMFMMLAWRGDAFEGIPATGSVVSGKLFFI